MKWEYMADETVNKDPKEIQPGSDLAEDSQIHHSSVPPTDQPQPQTGFPGTYFHNLDDKGRVSVPSAFRSQLSADSRNTLVLTNYVSDGTRCLDGYSLAAWRSFLAKLAARSRFDPQVRKLENFYLARAALCPIDASGRINIPSYLRHYAGLEKETVFVSSLHGFRLWDRRVWELIFSEAETALVENPALFLDVDK